MQLQSLLRDVPYIEIWGDTATEVGSLQYDSRKVKPGDVFVALPGVKVDGHRYIEQCLDAGAAGVIAEHAPTTVHLNKVWVRVENTRKALGRMADNFYGNPSTKLQVAGITGTNGKTTTTFLIQHLMNAAQRRAGLIGTVRYDTGARVIDSHHTTPESSDLHELLAEMREAGCRGAVMEVSSHGIEQYRMEGVQFDAAIFSNLTQDHLDYHGSMNDYFLAKLKLFQYLNDQPGTKQPVMAINGDDTYGERILRTNLPNVKPLTYGFGARCDYRASDYRCQFEGTTFQLAVKGRSFMVKSPLIGRFNVYNALAALTAVSGMGLNLREAINNLAEAPQVPGRMESVGGHIPFRVFVDYAHTPDAIEKACSTLRELNPARLITVFGCGGDRDRAKRPLMAAAACKYSDAIVLTSDNPRTEDPSRILRDAEAGMVSGVPHVAIEDRKEAIREAIFSARPRDVILIAGKGHETYQQFADRTIDFDDRLAARHCIEDWRRAAPDLV